MADENILDMDFGEFIDMGTGGQPVIEPPIDPAQKIEEPIKEEEELEVNKILQDSLEEGSEETTEDEEETEGIPPTSSNKEETDEDPFTLVLARYQLEQGVISSFDEEELLKIEEEEGPAAAMTYLLKQEIDSNTNKFKTDYDEYTKEFIALREAGYTADEAGALVVNLEEINDIEEDSLEDEKNEDLRRSLMKENYKSTTKFSESKIDRLIKRSFDLGDDVEDAKEALESLKEVRKEELTLAKVAKEKEQKEAEEAYKQSLQTLNNTIQSMEGIIPGEKLTKATKDKLIKTITTPVKNTEQGVPMNAIWSKRNEDPINFDIKLAYLLQAGIFDGKWDKIMKSAGTKVTSNIKDQLDKTTSTGFLKGGKRTTKVNDSENAGDMIGPMKSLFK
jgi:hypothetical protein